MCCLGGRRYYEAQFQTTEDKAEEYMFNQKNTQDDFIQFVIRMTGRRMNHPHYQQRPVTLIPSQVRVYTFII